QELFGAPSNLPWALKISPIHRPPGYLRFPTFEPTFLYEMIWNLLVAGFLIWLGQRRRVRPPGVFALYVAAYSGFRIFEETQRIDYSNYFLGLRVNFFVALVLCLLGLTWFVAIQRGWRGLGGAPGESWSEAPVSVAAGDAAAARPRSRPPPPSPRKARRAGGRR